MQDEITICGKKHPLKIIERGQLLVLNNIDIDDHGIKDICSQGYVNNLHLSFDFTNVRFTDAGAAQLAYYIYFMHNKDFHDVLVKIKNPTFGLIGCIALYDAVNSRNSKHGYVLQIEADNLEMFNLYKLTLELTDPFLTITFATISFASTFTMISFPSIFTTMSYIALGSTFLGALPHISKITFDSYREKGLNALSENGRSSRANTF